MTIYEILKVESPVILQELIQIFNINVTHIEKTLDFESVDWKLEMVTDAEGRYLGYSSRAMKL